MSRPFNRSTRLGVLLAERGWRVRDLEYASTVNARTLSDYLAGRRPIAVGHRQLLADAFDVDPSVLVEPVE